MRIHGKDEFKEACLDEDWARIGKSVHSVRVTSRKLVSFHGKRKEGKKKERKKKKNDLERKMKRKMIDR